MVPLSRTQCTFSGVSDRPVKINTLIADEVQRVFWFATNEPDTVLIAEQCLEGRDVDRVNGLSTETHWNYYNDGPPTAAGRRRLFSGLIDSWRGLTLVKQILCVH